MSRIYTRRTMAGIFILVSTIYFLFAVANKPRILVLHSYATDYVWVRKVSEGVRSVLDETPYDVRWHYMDTKRHPDPEFYARAGQTARRVIEEWKPRVVIAIDDHAQQYVASCYLRDEVTGNTTRGGPRSLCPAPEELSDLELDVVYTGVNAQAEDYGYEKAGNVTGLLQRLPLDLVKTALVETFWRECRNSAPNGNLAVSAGPNDCRLEVLYLRDSSTTSNWREREIMAAPWEPEFRLTSRAVETLAEWQQEILDAPRRFDLLLFSDYRKLRLAGKSGIADGDAVVAWNHACSRLPMIGVGSSYAEIGEAIGFSVAPFEQGEAAASMAIDIIRKRETEEQHSSEGLVVYLRGDLDGDHTLPDLYQAFARATGTHFDREPSGTCPGVVELPPVFAD